MRVREIDGQREEMREEEGRGEREPEKKKVRKRRERDISDVDQGQVPALPGTESLWPNHQAESQIKTKQREGQNNQQIKGSRPPLYFHLTGVSIRYNERKNFPGTISNR